MTGNSWADSYDSRQGAYESQTPGQKASIFTNSLGAGSVRLVGSSYVKGTIYLGPGARVGPAAPSQSTMGSANTVWKDWNCYSLGEQAMSSPVDVPPVEVPDAGASQGNVAFNYQGGNLAAGRYEQVLVTSGKVTLGPGTVVVKNFSLGGGGSVHTRGRTTLVVKEQLSIAGQVNLDGKPSDLKILMAEQAQATINQGSKVAVVLYGPQARVRITDGSSVYGSVSGDDTEIARGCRLHFDESLLEETSHGEPGRTRVEPLSWQRF
jgi:hypothetical protein